MLKEQINDLDQLIEAQKDMYQGFDKAEELLSNLKSKISEELSFEDKREIIKTLVRKIVVKSNINERGRFEADVIVNFLFSNIVTCTDKGSCSLPASVRQEMSGRHEPGLG
jgi:site-specific DNA recombinase